MSDFLPDDYKVPSKSDGYFKLQQGDNRFRIMGQPIIGWEWWTDTEDGGRKPNRVPFTQTVPSSHAETVKHFWAMVVYNYELKQFQILELTQKGIQKTIKNLSKDEDWGSPIDYDLVITKTGEKMDTEYEVKPKPKKELDQVVLANYKKTDISLEALFEGKDPFSSNVSLEEVSQIMSSPVKTKKTVLAEDAPEQKELTGTVENDDLPF